ncbi:MAG: hypothetical protein EPO22_03430 [Dehalococcoidia bacterium]|nr:MAG: hypothetical protein EPO22_03430 [Dehalococcoidia bacterium]
MQTLISFDPILPGLGLPIDLRRLEKDGRIEPGPGIGIRPVRAVAPRDLLESFLSVSFDAPASIESFLSTFGIPVKSYGADDEWAQDQSAAFFQELARISTAAIPAAGLAGLRCRFEEALGSRPDFYSVKELQQLQERIRRLAEPMLEAAAASELAPGEDLDFGYLNHELVGTRLQVRVNVVDVRGAPKRAIALSAADYYEFEPALWLGVLQCVVERQPVRPCHQCGRYFTMNERRGEHKFCNRACKQRWANDQRRLKRSA